MPMTRSKNGRISAHTYLAVCKRLCNTCIAFIGGFIEAQRRCISFLCNAKCPQVRHRDTGLDDSQQMPPYFMAALPFTRVQEEAHSWLKTVRALMRMSRAISSAVPIFNLLERLCALLEWSWARKQCINEPPLPLSSQGDCNAKWWHGRVVRYCVEVLDVVRSKPSYFPQRNDFILYEAETHQNLVHLPLLCTPP